MINKLFNPFKYIAGFKALFMGLAVIVITGCIGFLSKTNFPTIIDVKFPGPTYLSVWYYILQGMVNWLVFSVLLYMAALIGSKSSIRVIDIFGTQALARYPFLIVAFFGFSDSMDKFTKDIMHTFMGIGEPVETSSLDMIVASVLIILILVICIWMIVLMYNAFRVSANVKGPKSAILFIVVFIAAYLLSYFGNRFLMLAMA